MKKLFISLALIALNGCTVSGVQFVMSGPPDFVPKQEHIKSEAKALALSFDKPIKIYFNTSKKTKLVLGVSPVGDRDSPGCVLVYQQDLWEKAIPRIGFQSTPDKLIKLFVAHEITHCYIHHNSPIKNNGLQAESLADAGALLYVALNDPANFDKLALDLARLRQARQVVDSGNYPSPTQVRIMASRAKAVAQSLPGSEPITLELLDKVHPFLL